MAARSMPDLPSREVKQLPFTIDRVDEVRVQRADSDAETEVLRVEGHASVFDYEYKVYDGPPWGWVEVIESGAFDETLAADPDVVFLRNHVGMPLARTKSGTLTLGVDDVGLLTRADLDLANPEVRALGSALDRGDVDEMSFAFRVTEQNWSEHPDWEGDEFSLRKILSVNLHRGDVSAVTFGASDGTDLDIMRSIGRLNGRELAEARSAIEARISQGSGGMPGRPERDGMSLEVLEVLRIPSNTTLERYLS